MTAAPPRSRQEHTGQRPSCFSVWHRRVLPGWTFSCDIDCLGVRSGRGIVAVIETAEVDGFPGERRLTAIARKKTLQLRAVEEVGRALGVPYRFVLSSRTLPRVAVLDIATDRVDELAETEFWTTIEEL